MLHPTHVQRIENLIREQADQFGVRLYHYVNVGNHLHLVIRIQNRQLYQRFIRSISGLIARAVLKRERGPIDTEHSTSPSGNKNLLSKMRLSFWLARPFTRVVTWGRDFNFVSNYMRKNTHQVQAIIRTRFVAWGFDVIDPTLLLT